jgi:hypothetical protein
MPCKLRGFGGRAPIGSKINRQEATKTSLCEEGKIPFHAEPRHEVSVTARAKTDDSGYLLYYEGIARNITKALEDQRNRVLRNAAGGMCHYLNTHLMQLHGSNDAIREELESLDALIEKIAGEENPHEIANQMKGIMKDMHHFCRGISGAYERISEVTRAFNKACRYKEESYVTSTILDIFKAHGYQEDD